MSEQDHRRWRDELSPYLLGALGPAEVAELERHLAGCEECRRELDWLRPAAQLVPESVERVEPPPELRSRIMAEVDPRSASRRPAAGRLSGAHRHRRRLADFLPASRRPAAAIAAVILVVGVVVAYAVSGGDSGGGARTVSSGQAPGVTAKFVREGGSGTLRLAHLHQLPPDEVLQAWVRRGKRVESADVLFAPNHDGVAKTVIDDLHDVNTVMVTAEPRGGSDFPTSEPLIAVAISQ